MDGPQLEGRWSGPLTPRSSPTTPGCSVLDPDVHRALVAPVVRPRARTRRGRSCPLERGGGKGPPRLKLPSGAHALLLNIWPDHDTNHTLDGRSDHGGTLRLSLCGVHPITHPSPEPWAVAD